MWSFVSGTTSVVVIISLSLVCVFVFGLLVLVCFWS